MTTGIVDNRRALLLRLAWRVEGVFPDVAECVTEVDEDEDAAVVETRPEYLRVYRHTTIRVHPDGSLFALVLLDDAARNALAAVLSAVASDLELGLATEEERTIHALSAESELDASWDPSS